MKLHLIGRILDEPSNYAYFRMIVENEKFKATVEFYAETDSFKKFATQLEKFPFESKDPVSLDCGELKLDISLADSYGRINFKVSITDWDHNKVSFTDRSVVTADLQALAMKLKSPMTDKIEVSWLTSE